MNDTPRIYEQEFVYTSSVSTDIRKTFEKYGWKGPEAQRKEKEAEASHE